jgi:hypothetical protein
MKKFLFSLFGGLAISACTFSLLVLPTGCTTTATFSTQTNAAGSIVTVTNVQKVLNTNVVISVLNFTVPPAVTLACSKDTNAVAYFQQAGLILTALINSGQFSPTVVSNSLANISINQLRTPDAITAETMALEVYEAFAAQVVTAKLDQSYWLAPVLGALANDIQAGIPKQ